MVNNLNFHKNYENILTKCKTVRFLVKDILITLGLLKWA